MRCLFPALLLTVFLTSTAFAQSSLPKYPLAPLPNKAELSKLRGKQIELFNSAVEEFGSAYGRFTEGRSAVRELLEASERVLEAGHEVFETPADRINFASKHYSLATAIEEAVSAAGKDDQDLRLAKQLRLQAEIRMLKLTESPSPVTPAPAPAPAVGPVPAEPPMRAIPMRAPSKPTLPPGELKPLDEDALGKIEARYLDIRNTGGMYDFTMSDSGKYAIALEGKRDDARYAVWDLDKAKLLRYLSAEEGKETKEYKGEEEADFGAETKFALRSPLKFIFSPDAKYVVALTRLRPAPVAPGAPPAVPAPVKTTEEILVWDLASGKLLRTISGATHHPYTFFFVDKKRIAAKTFKPTGPSVDLIDAESGETETLLGSKGYEMHGGALTKGAIAFMIPSGGPLLVDLESKEETSFNAPPEGSSKIATDRSWFSKDGKELFLKKGGAIEVWDVESKSYRQQTQLVDDNRMFELVGFAPESNLVVRRLSKERRLEFIDAAESKVVGGITGLKRFELSGISQDGQRIALPTLDKKMLILDFPKGLPEGEIPITALEQKADSEPKR